MDEKISLEAIGQYGDRYSEKVVRSFFSGKHSITGPEILALTNVQQVNLFVVRELFRAWQGEQRKIRSPFFDYEAQEVKKAMEELMNLLSKNISIDAAHFEPLLNKAVGQALLVIFDPYDYFSMLITGENNRLEVSAIREEIKYLRINRAPLERMLQKLEERGVSELSGNEALGILDQILEEVNFTPDDIEEYIEKFSIVHPLNPNDFFVPRTDFPKETNVPPPPRMEIHTDENIRQEKVRNESPIDNPQHTTSVSTARQTPPKNASVPTLNEKHTREPRPTLADNFQRIGKIKENLTINQKFMFTKVLFHGDFELFSRAIDRLDQLDSLPAAIRYLEDEHASTWDRDSEEFHEFMELVEKRFA